jgi:hypothetical protein
VDKVKEKPPQDAAAVAVGANSDDLPEDRPKQ